MRKAYADVYASIDDKSNEKVQGSKPDSALRTKFLDSYKPAQVADPATEPDPFKRLAIEQGKWTEASLDRNKAVSRSDAEADLKTAQSWLTSKIAMLNRDIESLKKELGDDAGKFMPMQIVDEKGVTITDEDRAANPGMMQNIVPYTFSRRLTSSKALVGRPAPKEANEWTRVKSFYNLSMARTNIFTGCLQSQSVQ